ncbi:MAG: ArsR family transcriptional regulator [Candidatus Nanoarchaeia archaeon]
MDHITIIRLKKPRSNEINEELQWLGASLGLFNLRDKDKSCFRIFIELIKNARIRDEPLTSDQIAYRLNLTRGTVIHHVNKLMNAGIVEKEGNRGYNLRTNKLSELIEELQKDMTRNFEDLKRVAEGVDRKLKK